jgi:hypothetical protein
LLPHTSLPLLRWGCPTPGQLVRTKTGPIADGYIDVSIVRPLFPVYVHNHQYVLCCVYGVTISSPMHFGYVGCPEMCWLSSGQRQASGMCCNGNCPADEDSTSASRSGIKIPICVVIVHTSPPASCKLISCSGPPHHSASGQWLGIWTWRDDLCHTTRYLCAWSRRGLV